MSLNRNQRPDTAAEMRNALRDVGQAELEQATLPLPRPPALKSTSLPPTPPPEPTRKAPEPASQSAPASPHVPTMRVDSPPAVPTWERNVASSTAASFAGETDKERKTGFSFQFRWGRIAFIVASLLVAATSIVVWRTTLKRPTTLTATAPTQNDNHPNTATPSNPTAPAGMAYVPGGEFTMGRDDGDEFERPAHKVTVKPFFMDMNEVTRQQYQDFVNKTGHGAPANWTNKHFPAGTGQQPVTGVTWDDANAYAKWAGKHLPTEEEWEFAARGTDGRRYPWGNDWQQGSANANSASNGVANVGSFKGDSPFQLFDTIGNAWEWTASKLAAYPGGQLPQGLSGERYVIRGGSYDSDANTATTTYRRGYPARGNYDYSKTGFRCAKDVN